MATIRTTGANLTNSVDLNANNISVFDNTAGKYININDKYISTSEIIKATKWSSGFTDHNMFKYFKPDFYKHFLEKKTRTTKKNHKGGNHKHTSKRKSIFSWI